MVELLFWVAVQPIALAQEKAGQYFFGVNLQTYKNNSVD